MKKIFTLTLAFLLSLSAFSQIQRPRLVVGLVVDQMRWDYLYYYYDAYRTDGLRRLLNQGYSYENTMLNYVPTVTAIGHTSIYTGSVPAFHGISGNYFYVDGKKTYCCADSTVHSVGSESNEGKMSPHYLLATGIGDELKVATDYRAKVIGVALKDRASILPAGHAADAAYWWDTSAGKFITSSYYMDKLPEWVNSVNARIGTKPGTDVKGVPAGITKTFQMAEAALRNEKLGKDDITDLLTISVSSTDIIGHTYGTRGSENKAAYMELDKQVAKFLNTLDAQVGKGNYLLFLSADHGAAHNHNLMKEHKIPAGGLEMWTWIKDVDRAVADSMGIAGKLIKDEDAGRLYLDHNLIEKSGKNLSDIKQALINKIEQNKHIAYVIDYDKALTTSVPLPLRERVVNGYNKKRSGDLFVVAIPYWENVSNKPSYRGTTHGQWNPYDAHIPFVLYGWHVTPGQHTQPVYVTDIAPTICEMLHIQMPNACVGQSRQ